MDKNVVIRHDDFDFRHDLKKYKEIHEPFLKYDITHTVNIQFFHNEQWRPKEDIVKYLLEEDNYDIQLHGWRHVKYGLLDFETSFAELSACCLWFNVLFGKRPEVFYPPWNHTDATTKKACDNLGIKISNENLPMKWYYKDHIVEGKDSMDFPEGHKRFDEFNTMYFHDHDPEDTECLDEVLKYINNKYK